jgi:hypothetical protein
MEAMALETTAVNMLRLRHDISAVNGEEIVLFTLAEAPLYCET